MKYFILYLTTTNDPTFEYYMKGKSAEYLLERIERYSEGCLSTSKSSINTWDLQSAFVREINPSDFHLSKNDFAMINESKSYGKIDQN